LGLTAHRTAEWIAQQLVEAFGWRETPRYVVVTRRLRTMGIRLIGSIRRECLDHVSVFGERHLLSLLRCYQNYYDEYRTHLSLYKDAPLPHVTQVSGSISANLVLGGLHHQFCRV
jgi:hypothetical protein